MHVRLKEAQGTLVGIGALYTNHIYIPLLFSPSIFITKHLLTCMPV